MSTRTNRTGFRITTASILAWHIVLEHGWLKGKIRVKHCDGQVFMIKTMKLTDAEGARKIKAKSELMKKRRMEKAAEKRAAKLMRSPFSD